MTMTSPTLSRRRLLQAAGVAGGGLYVASQFPFPNAARAAAEIDAPAVLTKDEWASVDAICARILPSDHEPGAREARCVNFIDKALANEEAAALPIYRSGLPALDAVANAMHGAAFVALDDAQKDAVLVAIEAGNADAWPAEGGESAVFFETIRVHTLLGFLADPRYGGNHELAGWKVSGYPGPRHHQGGYTPEQVEGDAPIERPWDDAKHEGH